MGAEGSKPEFRPESYRAYLRLIAQSVSLRADVKRQLDASDLVQECFVRAIKFGDQFVGRSEIEYRSWLRSILANVVLEFLRRISAPGRMASIEQSIHATVDESGKRLDGLLIGPSKSPAVHAADQEAVERLLAAVAQLPSDQQQAVRLHFLQQMSIEEVAAAMNRSTASVAGLMRRGLKQLRSDLQTSRGKLYE